MVSDAYDHAHRGSMHLFCRNFYRLGTKKWCDQKYFISEIHTPWWWFGPRPCVIKLQLTHGFQTPMTGKIHTLTWRVIFGKLFNFGPFGNFQCVAETYIREGEPIIALTIPRLPSATQFLLATCPLEGFASTILPSTHYFEVITAILVVFEAISSPMWSLNPSNGHVTSRNWVADGSRGMVSAIKGSPSRI